VIGATTPVTVDTSGVTVPVTGVSTPVTVEITGDAVLVTSSSEPVTGASAPAVAGVTEDAAAVTGESVWRTVLTPGLTVLTPGPTVPVMGAIAPVAVETAGARVLAVETGDIVLAEVTAFVPVADVCVTVADELSAPATGASVPVVVPASEAGAWATVPIGVSEVTVEGVDPAAAATGTADVAADPELTVADPELVEPLPCAEEPESVVPTGGLEAAWASDVACETVALACETVVLACEAAEETGDVAELMSEVTGDVEELAAEVIDDAAELTAEVTGDAAEVTVESDDPDGVSEVAACACRENRSMITNIPAATIASCTARRAMRRTIGCGMSSSHSPETGRGTRAHH